VQVVQYLYAAGKIAEAESAEAGLKEFLKFAGGVAGGVAGSFVPGAGTVAGAAGGMAVGAGVATALDKLLTRMNAAEHLVAAGRSMGAQEGVMGGATRAAYSAGKPVQGAVRTLWRMGPGMLMGAAKSMWNMSSEPLSKAAGAVGDSASALWNEDMAVSKNMDVAEWQKGAAPKADGADAGPKPGAEAAPEEQPAAAQAAKESGPEAAAEKPGAKEKEDDAAAAPVIIDFGKVGDAVDKFLMDKLTGNAEPKAEEDGGGKGDEDGAKEQPAAAAAAAAPEKQPSQKPKSSAADAAWSDGPEEADAHSRMEPVD
jgi:hypothetical protein